MAFERYKKLSEEKFTVLVNMLRRGESMSKVARLMQQEWKMFTDKSESTLGKDLSRFQKYIGDGGLGKDAQEELEKNKGLTPLERLANSTFNCMEELRDILEIRRTRMERLIDGEDTANKNNPELDKLLEDQTELILKMQKVRFDLGLDEFRGVVPGNVRATRTDTQLPDGTLIRQHTIEAMNTMDEVFTRHGILKAPMNPLTLNGVIPNESAG